MSEDIRTVVRTVRWSPQPSKAVVFVGHSYNFPVKSESTNKCRMFKKILVGYYSKILTYLLLYLVFFICRRQNPWLSFDMTDFTRRGILPSDPRTKNFLRSIAILPETTKKHYFRKTVLKLSGWLHLVCSLPVPYILCSSLFPLPACDVILCPLTVNVVLVSMRTEVFSLPNKEVILYLLKWLEWMIDDRSHHDMPFNIWMTWS